MVEDLKRATRFLERDTLTSALRGAGLDAAVVQSAKNVWYMSGHPRVGSSQRPGGPGAALAVGTRDGDSALVVGRWHSGLASKLAWSDEVVRFRNFAQSGFHTVADVLEAKGLVRGTIGVELDYVSDKEYRHLVGAMPEATFLDLGGLIDELRVRKDARQLAESARAYERLATALRAGLEASRGGDTRVQIHNRIMREILRQGTDTGRGGIGAAGQRIVPLVSTQAMPAARGDALVLDYTCSFGPYAAHISRTVVVGAPEATVADRYARQHEALLASVAGFRAGMPANEAARSVQERLTAAGLACAQPVVGHGVSLGFEDMPVLSPASRDRLEPGMEFVVAPRVQGGLMVSLRCVMTETGVELSDSGFAVDRPYVLDK